ncbi:MAG: DUF2971 domain-containing protein [Sphingomonas adhaesiva]|uniref:DUF2971 domain-containing protein n=1 Tax=Sphingomonas adhaesiva TaxID=28212 RepID=UPI002FF96F17
MAAISEAKAEAKFKAISNRWVEETRVARSGEVPEEVFHYTDAAGLHGMLSQHSIWLTDHRFLNDKTEAAYTKTLVRSILDKLDSDDAITRAFLKRMRILSEIRSNDDSFVFSLSEASDDLSQWRGYARDGQGFTLGFDANVLHTVGRPDDAEYSFAKVEYDPDRQSSTLEKMIREFITTLGGMKLDATADEKIIKVAADKADWAVENKSLLNKHRSFQSEKEWRIVSYCSPKHDDVRVRTSGLRLVPYNVVKPQGDDVELLPLTSIRIGPGFDDPEAVRDAVRTLADIHGYKPRIEVADTPYRKV